MFVKLKVPNGNFDANIITRDVHFQSTIWSFDKFLTFFLSAAKNTKNPPAIQIIAAYLDLSITSVWDGWEKLDSIACFSFQERKRHRIQNKKLLEMKLQIRSKKVLTNFGRRESEDKIICCRSLKYIEGEKVKKLIRKIQNIYFQSFNIIVFNRLIA